MGYFIAGAVVMAIGVVLGMIVAVVMTSMTTKEN